MGLYGAPPLWARRPGFASLLRIILEQQVSLASAQAIYLRLAAAAGEVKPKSILALGTAGLQRLGLTRQKASYACGLAEEIVEGRLALDGLGRIGDDEAREQLMRVRGIGPWTAGIYLLMALRRPDIWPTGDLALHKALDVWSAPAWCRRPVRPNSSPRAGGLCGRSRLAFSGTRTSRSERPDERFQPTSAPAGDARFAPSGGAPMRVNDLQRLYDYSYWANKQLFGVVSRLTPEQFTQLVAGSYGSIRNTLVHVLSAEWGWLDRCGGPARGERLDPQAYPTVESVVRVWTRVEQDVRGFLSGLGDADLTRDIQFVIGDGPRYALPLGDLMQHAAVHAVHHRGQVALLLRTLGYVPGNFDFLEYIREKGSVPA